MMTNALQVIKYEVSGLTVFIVTLPTHAGYFFEWNSNFFGDYIKVKNIEVDVETISMIKNMAHDTIQRIKNQS